MTSSTGTSQHPDVSEIADLTDGLLPPSRQAEIRGHLDGCPLCSEVRESLEEIRGLLGTLPGPQRMPDDIAGRIDAALAAEAVLSAGTLHEEAVEPAGVSRETPGRSEPGGPAPADRPAGRPPAATGPGRDRTARRRRRTAVLGAALGIAAAGMSVVLLRSTGTGTDSAEKSHPAVSSADTASGLSQSTLGDRVHQLLASGATIQEVSPGSKTEPAAPRMQPMRTAEGVEVPACVQRGTGRGEPPLAAEQSTFEGTKAFLVVFPRSGDDSQVQAYVVDASCVESAPAGKGELLLTESYPRP
ncbi:anti-sigma factor family protein [Streptomyces sp. NPDC127084]|uniref:anti-sigma factor family protein n=1 Tax=Streptomyces sp. NPDC127084 TaxID=3347133 RepID=UPI00365071B1